MLNYEVSCLFIQFSVLRTPAVCRNEPFKCKTRLMVVVNGIKGTRDQVYLAQFFAALQVGKNISSLKYCNIV